MAASLLASGHGVIAVTAVRKLARARWTSCRTAPSERPIEPAIDARLRPSKAVATSASRCVAGSAESFEKTSMAWSRRCTASSSGSPAIDAGSSSASIFVWLPKRMAVLRRIW